MTRGLLASTREYEYYEWHGYEYMTRGAGTALAYSISIYGLVSQDAGLSARERRHDAQQLARRCGGTADQVSCVSVCRFLYVHVSLAACPSLMCPLVHTSTCMCCYDKIADWSLSAPFACLRRSSSLLVVSSRSRTRVTSTRPHTRVLALVLVLASLACTRAAHAGGDTCTRLLTRESLARSCYLTCELYCIYITRHTHTHTHTHYLVVHVHYTC